MTNTTLLEEYIAKAGYKKCYLARALGITGYALSMKIKGKTEFKASEIDILCEVLNIGVEDRMRIFFAKTVD